MSRHSELLSSMKHHTPAPQAEAANNSIKPPSKPRPTVHVGICGHRFPHAEESAIKDSIRFVLAKVKQVTEELLADKKYATYFTKKDEPVFRMISPLAEGADRMAAKVAVEMGYELQVVLPMARDEYVKTFKEVKTDALVCPLPDQFEGLLDKASAIYEISAANYDRRSENSVKGYAYSDAGRVMLNHSDLLIAVWDGKDTGFIAGTNATIDMAMSSHIPVVHIDSHNPGHIRIIKDGFVAFESKNGDGFNAAFVQELNNHLSRILLPVKTNDVLFKDADFNWMTRSSRWEVKLWRSYQSESLVSSIVKMLGCVFYTLPRKLFKLDKKEASPEKKAIELNVECHEAEWVNNPFAEHYHTFEACSQFYSRTYRNVLVLRYTATLFAVLCLALIQDGVPKDWINDHVRQCLLMIQAFLLIYLTIRVLYENKRKKSHRKFFSCRVMAELFRLNGYLWHMGFCNVGYKHRSYEDEHFKWTSWYFRAFVRQVGLPGGIPGKNATGFVGSDAEHGGMQITKAKIADWLAWIHQDMLKGQISYHERRADRDDKLMTYLWYLGLIAYVLWLVVAVGRAAQPYIEIKALPSIGLFLPALVAFFAGYKLQMGYAGNKRLATQTNEVLRAINEDVEAMLCMGGSCTEKLPKGEINYSHARKTAERIHRCYIDELLEWESIIKTKIVKYD